MTGAYLQLMALLAFACAAISARGQLANDQTHGFGANRLVTFTYLQNFDCVDQPRLDLDFNGVPAESDPNEMQVPICQPVTEPTQDPTGGKIEKTAHLYVLVPMFSVDNDQNPEDAMPCPNGGRRGELCGRRLGEVLIKLFGAIPEAWKAKVNPRSQRNAPTPIIPYQEHVPCTLRQWICLSPWRL